MSTTAMAIYGDAKAELSAYVRGLDEGQLGLTCGACPDWSIQDTLAHHIHAQRSLIDGTFPPAGMTALTTADAEERAVSAVERDAWAAAGVDARRERTLEELLAEWDEVEETLKASEAIVLVADLTVHFDDIRETLEGRVARVGADVPYTLGRYHHFQTARSRAMGLPAVDIEAVDTGERLRGDGSVLVRGGAYELLRCLVGRRSRAEADESLEWGEADEATRAEFPIYGWND